MNKNRKSTVKKSVFFIALLTLLVILIGGTYARYSTSVTPTAKFDVAKWDVQLKQGNTEITNSTILNFTLANNANVADGKIAPGVTATADVTVDLSGTEVAVDLEAALASTFNAQSVFGVANDKISVTATIDGSSTVSLSQTEGKNVAFAANTTKTMHVTLTWTNDDENNTNDTTLGVNAPQNVQVPVVLTAKQHVGNN